MRPELTLDMDLSLPGRYESVRLRLVLDEQHLRDLIERHAQRQPTRLDRPALPVNPFQALDRNPAPFDLTAHEHISAVLDARRLVADRVAAEVAVGVLSALASLDRRADDPLPMGFPKPPAPDAPRLTGGSTCRCCHGSGSIPLSDVYQAGPGETTQQTVCCTRCLGTGTDPYRG